MQSSLPVPGVIRANGLPVPFVEVGVVPATLAQTPLVGAGFRRLPACEPIQRLFAPIAAEPASVLPSFPPQQTNKLHPVTTNYTTPDTYSFPRTLRTTLPDPFYVGGLTDADAISTGLYLTALYWQPKAKRLIARTYSIWAKQDGTHIGERFEEVCPSQYGRIALHDWSIEQHMTAAGLLPWVLNSI